MRKSLFYGLGIPAIYFGVSFVLSSLFDKATTEAFLITFGCPLIVTFIVALVTEVVSDDYERVDVDVKPEPITTSTTCASIAISEARDVLDRKVIPLLNGTRDRSWVSFSELPDWENSIKHGYMWDLLSRMLYQVLEEHHASPYIRKHTGINYITAEGFEIRRYE